MTKEHGICERAEIYYYDCLKKDWGQIPDEVLQHLNTCLRCQDRIGRLCAKLKQVDEQKIPTKNLLPLHYQLMDRWVCCGHVKPFLPVLAMDGQDISVATPVTVHIDRCPDCASDFQEILQLGLSRAQLQDAACFLSGQPVESLDDQPELKVILEKISARSDSSVAIRTSVKSQSDLAMDGEVSLEIEQAERLDQPVLEELVKVAPVQLKVRKRRPVTRIASMAALLVLATYLLIQIQPASVKGLGLKDVYAAMSQVTNVCIKTMVPEQAQPIQTLWISNSLQTICSQTTGKSVLLDMKSQPSEMVQIPWGLLPFKQISDIPDGYEWTHIESIHEFDGKPVLVYDYTWQDGTPGLYVQRKWRGYLSPETKLPQKIEWWAKLPGREFEIVTIQLIDYPQDQQVKAVIQEAEQLQSMPTP